MSFKNKGREREYNEGYYQKHKEAQKESSRSYYSRNRERVREYQKGYYRKNKERLLERKNAHRRANREHYRKYSRDYWRERYGGAVREKALILLGGCCFLCKRVEEEKKGRRKLHFHRKDGRKHKSYTSVLVLKHPKEWVLLCVRCHKGVHFCMEVLGMLWNKIKNLKQRR